MQKTPQTSKCIAFTCTWTVLFLHYVYAKCHHSRFQRKRSFQFNLQSFFQAWTVTTALAATSGWWSSPARTWAGEATDRRQRRRRRQQQQRISPGVSRRSTRIRCMVREYVIVKKDGIVFWSIHCKCLASCTELDTKNDSAQPFSLRREIKWGMVVHCQSMWHCL